MSEGQDRPAVLYLVRHGATEANLARPYKLQGQGHDLPLTEQGIRQAESTRDLLASVSFAHCYTSPMLRATRTAEILCEPHQLTPTPLPALTECHMGRWEGLDWDTIKEREPDACARFHAYPGQYGYPEGETFADVRDRAAPVLNQLLSEHRGANILVVAHHVVNRTYLAGVFGLSPDEATRVTLNNCGVSVVVLDGDQLAVRTVNANFHLPPLEG